MYRIALHAAIAVAALLMSSMGVSQEPAAQPLLPSADGPNVALEAGDWRARS